MGKSATLIRNARVAAGLSQAQLAKRTGRAQPAIARLERPGSNPTVATLSDVLHATGHQLEISARRRPPSVDETQIRERLALSPAERLATFSVSQRNVRRLLAKAKRVDGE
jgi:transcriptional regulator with XRE-family HTH domain